MKPLMCGNTINVGFEVPKATLDCETMSIYSIDLQRGRIKVVKF